MSFDALNAAKAYGNQQKMMQSADSAASDSEVASTPFLDMVESASQNLTSTLKASEAAQLQSLTGNGDLTNLVTAISSAELTLNTVVAVRDRVINAYNDIIKMSI
jgi:flagellar hook-basal body complex protein FliE